jgi:hypothetical protein
MTDPCAASRPKKFEHLDTIQYEIDMLDYCYDQLQRGLWAHNASYYLSIEGFLLHYRNLTEFFGSTKDLKANDPSVWACERKLTEQELASIQDESVDKKYNSQISQYLAHCTKSRANRDRDWNILEMYDEIKLCLQNFRRLFPVQRVTSAPIQGLLMTNASTSSLSHSAIRVDYVWNAEVDASKKQT